MTIARRLLLASFFCTAAFAGGTAHAAPASDEGWYVGASAGRTEFTFPNGGGELDADGYSVHGGYRISRHVALEASYADLGSASFQYDCEAGLVCVPEIYPIAFHQSYSRVNIALVGILPLNERFDLFAKVGFGESRYEESVRYGISTLTDRSSDESSETLLGLGGRLHFNAPWSLRLQWDRSEVSGVEVDGYWLGVEYRFAR